MPSSRISVRTFVTLVAVAALLAVAFLSGCATVRGSGDGVESAPGFLLKDEGTAQGMVFQLDCTGAGISCSRSGRVGTANVTGGGSGSANVVSVPLTFVDGEPMTNGVVTGQTWVTAASIIVCSPQLDATASGSNNTVEAYVMANFSVTVAALVVGTGFTLYAASPAGVSGVYNFSCTGA